MTTTIEPYVVRIERVPAHVDGEPTGYSTATDEDVREKLSESSIQYINDAVGGHFDVAFTVASPRGRGYAITGYVHDEGLLIGLPIKLGVYFPNHHLQLFAGNMLIAGVDTRNGESEPLTELEREYLDERRVQLSLLPHEGFIFSEVTIYDFTTERKRRSR